MKICRALLIPCVLLLTSAGAAALPQAKPKAAQPLAAHRTHAVPKFFRLHFVLKELQGKKVLNIRNYTTEISVVSLSQTLRHDFQPFMNPYDVHSIHNGTRVPVQTAPGKYNYVETGVDIDCWNAALIGNRLAMTVTGNIRTIRKDKALQARSQLSPPFIRENRWSSKVLVPIGRSTVLFTSDDPDSPNTMELQLTAIPIQ